MEKGRTLGLITEGEVARLREKVRMIESGMAELEKRKVTVDLGEAPKRGTTLKQALRQPEVSYGELAGLNPDFKPVDDTGAAEQIEIQVKYEGYLERQEAMVEKVRRLDALSIPEDLDYTALGALSREVKDRLAQVRPANLGQASRIPGVTPAAVSALMIYIKSRTQDAGRRTQKKTNDQDLPGI
jgi:tRNA uridine 5-carboxymethylaminomethyl modification enzyme